MSTANGFLRLDGRCAVVTGGAQGIGLAVARRLAGAGAHVEVWDREGATADASVAAMRADKCYDVTAGGAPTSA